MKYHLLNNGTNIEILNDQGVRVSTAIFRGFVLDDGTKLDFNDLDLGQPSPQVETKGRSISLEDAMLLLKPTKELIELKKAGFNV